MLSMNIADQCLQQKYEISVGCSFGEEGQNSFKQDLKEETKCGWQDWKKRVTGWRGCTDT